MTVPLSMTLLSFDMDQPINQAHVLERKAESLLKEGKWDEAVKSYNMAARMMRKAMENVQVSSPKVALPLRLQAEKFENMKNVIGIKRQENNSSIMMSPEKSFQKSSQSSPERNHDSNKPAKHSESSHQKQKIGDLTVDKGTETSGISKLKFEKASKFHAHSMAHNTWQHLTHDFTNERDSLLQFLNVPDEENLCSSTRKKKPKNQDTVIEEYKTRFNTLRNVAFQLVSALDSAENENRSLRLDVEELRSEVANLNERLMYYEENQKYLPLDYPNEPRSNSPTNQFHSDEMTVSMLINQPESYFKFEKKDITSEIEQAINEEDFPFDKKFKTLPYQKPKRKNHTHEDWQNSPATMDSVKYEELDDGTNAEVSETVSNSVHVSHSSDSYPSVAGLPPLSPVHFEPADDFGHFL